MQALALDMGGTHIGCGVVEANRVLAEASLDAEGASSLADLLPVVEDTLRTLLREAGTTAELCAGMAIGFPGIVDARDATIHYTLKKYQDAPKLDLVTWARELFGLRLRIENDARMALMGEKYAGAGLGVEDVVIMTLGTGIGSAAILNGRLLRGVHAHAGLAEPKPLLLELCAVSLQFKRPMDRACLPFVPHFVEPAWEHEQ